MLTKREISTDTLDEALLIAAQLVSQFGPRFAPVFERIEQEVERLKLECVAVDRARELIRAREDG